MTAADAARGAAAVHIASAGALADFHQALFRLGFCYVAIIRIRDVARGRRKRSKCFNWHKSKTSQTKSATWRAEPSFLPPDGWSVIGSAGYAVRPPIRDKRSVKYSSVMAECNRFLEKNGEMCEP